MTLDHGLVQALEAGIKAVRYGAISWKDVEPVRTDPPTYHWDVLEALDADLISAAQADMQVALLVLFTPDWAQAVPGHSCGPIREDKLDAFAQFLLAVVGRYSNPPYNVKYWELFNEPDVDPSHVPPDSVFGCWGNQDDEYYGARVYAEMLKQAYPAIKQADPQAQVLMGGLLLDCDPHNPPPDKDCSSATFLEGILASGGGPFFDIAGYHAYTYYRGGLGQMANPNWPGSVTTVLEKGVFLRDVLDRHGYEEKPLISSEAALLCFRPTDECLETQAMYVPRAYAEALALGLEGQIYYAMINEEWRHTGLLLPDLTPKPVYRAYNTATFFLAAVTYEGPAMGYPPGIAGYAFRRNDAQEYIDVIWSVDGSVQNVALPSEASAHDRYGGLVASSGVVQVDLSPVYVLRR
ncbi:hypothetical protein ACFLYD_06940 [Chloroflexota bacterium]